jgi:5-(hydroxymethyl)furfural/furfural oxidase
MIGPAARFDHVIVGGGSAGCVLANRLSAKPGRRVLLIEAGPDLTAKAMPDVLADSYPGQAAIDPRFQFLLSVTTEPGSHNRAPDTAPPVSRPYMQGRVLGGGSSINGQLANRGAPGDYDEWQALGAEGWGWDSVLPFFRKLERDLDCGGPLHGKDGPIAIRRLPEQDWNGYTRAAAAVFAASGFEYLPDQNGPFRDGYFPIAMSNMDDRRVSTATAYLSPDIRRRPNLAVMTDTSMMRLVMDAHVCVGVEVMIAGAPAIIDAGEVIVSCGAIHSPAHLLRAGIGPAADLRAQGITVVADRPGVGQRMMDHPAVSLGSFVRPAARWGQRSRRHMQIGLRYTSGIGDIDSDMFLGVITKTAWHAVGDQIAALSVFIGKSFSDKGSVTLASTDWRDQPRVDFRLLADYRDTARLMDGFRRLVVWQTMPELRAVSREIFPASYSQRVRAFNSVNLINRVRAQVARRLLDGPVRLRSLLVRRMIAGGVDVHDIIADDEQLETFVRNSVIGVWHPCCSCRMGAANDPMAVTDSQGRVHGVAGLRVVDASIFPMVPRANLNVPTIMTAEKIAEGIVTSR